MKKILLSIGFGALVLFGSAQTVFNVDSPASIGGSYDFEYADSAGVAGSVWGVADLRNTMNTLVDTLVLVNAIDTVVAGVSITDSTWGCASYINAADVSGKIAVIFRGECEFGFKAKTAQDAGAVGVIIINNEPGNPIGMAAGTYGAQVTIPVVMISDVDGATIVNTMMTEDVVVFMGNKSGRYPNDLSIDENEVLRPRHTAIPSSLALDNTELEVKAGAWIRNYGYFAQYGVKLVCDVTFGGSSVYNEEVIVPDSLVTGDSIFVTFPTFSQATYPEGEYDFNYTLTSDSTDNFDADNAINSKMLINPKYISIGTVDATTGLPMTPADTYYWFKKSCLAYSNPNGGRVGVRGLTFSASSTRFDSLQGKFLEIVAYEWDGSDFSSMTDVASGSYDFNANLNEVNVTAQFSDAFKLKDYQNYLFCVENSSSDTIYIGHSDIGYGETNVEYNAAHGATLQTGTTSQITAFGDITAAISVETLAANTVGVDEEIEESLTAYPNPARNMISIPVGNLDVKSVVVFDVTGKIVSNQDVSTTSNNLTLDVTTIPNGMYVIALNKADNTTSKINVVISK